MAEQKQHGLWFHLLDIGVNILVIIAIVTGIRTFLVSPFQVEGNSMVSTLEDSEYIVINKLTYFIGTPQRGDVVVFRPPVDPSKFYVKRVIGTPGDEVILRGGKVYLKEKGSTDEKELHEVYLNPRNQGKTFRHPPQSGNGDEIVYDVPPDKYFVMGDNRQGSSDSRSFMDDKGEPEPFVPRYEIKGKVWFVVLPVTKIHALEPPSYEN